MTNSPDTNYRKVKRTVYTLLALSVITFMSGFLKYTSFEHSTILLIFLLFVLGIVLLRKTYTLKLKRYIKFFLVIMGIATVIFMLLVVMAAVKSISSGISLSDSLESLEGLFYLNSLLFLTGGIGSILLLTIKGRRNSFKSKSEAP